MDNKNKKRKVFSLAEYDHRIHGSGKNKNGIYFPH